jgi:hypothetical protein
MAGAPTADLASRPTAAPARTAPPALEGELFPFRFLRRLGERPGSPVVLFGNGRVVTVNAPGALDDTYAVDEIQADHLVLRHLRLGRTKVMELALRQPAPGHVTGPRTARRIEQRRAKKKELPKELFAASTSAPRAEPKLLHQAVMVTGLFRKGAVPTRSAAASAWTRR